MSGGWKRAQPAGNRPLDGRVRPNSGLEATTGSDTKPTLPKGVTTAAEQGVKAMIHKDPRLRPFDVPRMRRCALGLTAWLRRCQCTRTKDAALPEAEPHDKEGEPDSPQSRSCDSDKPKATSDRSSCWTLYFEYEADHDQREG